jgi:hypothetical protein
MFLEITHPMEIQMLKEGLSILKVQNGTFPTYSYDIESLMKRLVELEDIYYGK